MYNQNAIKSAIGNQGTYDINNPDITKAKGGIIKKDIGGTLRALSTPNNISRVTDIPYIADAVKSAQSGNYGDLVGSVANTLMPTGAALAFASPEFKSR